MGIKDMEIKTMDIMVNSKLVSIPVDATVTMLLKLINMSNHVAVFVNDRPLLLMEYDGYCLKKQDQVRIIRPLGGG